MGPGPPSRQYYWQLLFYVCTVVREDAKETECEETRLFLSHFCHWWHFDWGRRAPYPPRCWLRL